MRNPQLDPQRAANLAENPHAGQGMVMLDIGDDVGAIVLHLPAALEGAEVEIEPGDAALGSPNHARHLHNDPFPAGHAHGDHAAPTHSHPHRPHVAVVGRPVGEQIDYSAVFPALTEGSYTLFVPGSTSPVRINVRGGEVSEVVWSDNDTT